MFGSNVAPRRMVKQLKDWCCIKCGNWNRGERYSCEHCPQGRRQPHQA